MKTSFYSLAGIITVLALIIAFENIAAGCQVLLLLERVNSLFFPLLLMFFLGILTGLFIGLAQAVGKSSKEGGNDFDL